MPRSVLFDFMYLERPKIQIQCLLCAIDTTTSCRLSFGDESQHDRLEAQRERENYKSQVVAWRDGGSYHWKYLES